MNDTQVCARCGNALNGFAADDLCAFCLLQDGLSPSDQPEGALASGAAAVPSSRVVQPLPWDGTKRSSFGDYELIEEIARGGMGIVFKARHRSLNRVVALKMVLPGQHASKGFIERFHTEAEAAARLDHAHIVPVYEIAEHEGQHYFTMKLIEGRTLAERLDASPGRSVGSEAPASPPDPPTACGPADTAVLVAKVARAIHCAHQHGILHRDLKPANILIDRQGEPFVSDFGLAKILEKEGNLTLTEAVLGTASYMAPEQAAGQSKHLTTAADIYSIGAILYELLTGQVPFRGPTPMETMRQVVEQEPPPPRSIQPAVDRDLETICLKCLEKEPRDRYGSAEAVAEDLDRWLRHEPVLARPSTIVVRMRKWVRRKPMVAAFSAAMVFVLVLAVGGVFWQWRRAEIRGDLLQQQADIMQRTLYAAEMKAARQAWNDARTGDVLALLRKYGPGTGLEDLRGFEWRQLWWLCHQDQATIQSHRTYICEIAFSPDGTRVAAAGERDGVRVYDVASLEPVTTLRSKAGWVGSLFFLEDNQTLAFDRNDGRLMLWDTTTDQSVELLDGQLEGMWPLRLSPDGRWAAAVDSAQPRVLRVWDVASGRVVNELAGIAFHSPYTLENRLLFSADSSRLAIALSDKSVRLLSIPDLTPVVSLVLTDHPRCLALSPDGKLLAAGVMYKPHVQIWELASQQLIHTLRGPHQFGMYELRFSSDSTLLASSSYESIIALWSLAAPERELAAFKGHTQAAGVSLAFSPDSRLLASGGRDGAIKFWNTDISPASPSETALPAGAWQAEFSPDGRTLAVAADGGKVKLFDPVSEAWLGTLEDPDDTGMPVEPYTAYYRPLAISPDGRLLAMCRGDRTVRVWDFETRQLLHALTNHTRAVLCVAFAPDSKTLATAGYDHTIRLWDPRTGRQTGALETRELVVRTLAFSPRGGVLAYGGWTRSADSQPVTLWDYEMARLVATLPHHPAPPSALAFSRDGGTLASGDSDGIVRLWNLENIRSIRNPPVLSGHHGPISSLVFSPDEINLVATSFGGTGRIWHLPAMLDAGDLSSRQDFLASAAFSPDGNTLALASRERGVQLFHAVPIEKVPAQRP